MCQIIKKKWTNIGTPIKYQIVLLLKKRGLAYSLPILYFVRIRLSILSREEEHLRMVFSYVHAEIALLFGPVGAMGTGEHRLLAPALDLLVPSQRRLPPIPFAAVFARVLLIGVRVTELSGQFAAQIAGQFIRMGFRITVGVTVVLVAFFLQLAF